MNALNVEEGASQNNGKHHGKANYEEEDYKEAHSVRQYSQNDGYMSATVVVAPQCDTTKASF